MNHNELLEAICLDSLDICETIGAFLLVEFVLNGLYYRKWFCQKKDAMNLHGILLESKRIDVYCKIVLFFHERTFTVEGLSFDALFDMLTGALTNCYEEKFSGYGEPIWAKDNIQ